MFLLLELSKQLLRVIAEIEFTYHRHQTLRQNTLLHNMAMKFRRHKLLPFGEIVTCTEKEREEEENYVIHYSVRIRGIPISIFKNYLYKAE